ncbi:hypothetical protein [Streptomyces sp. ML-6]|nr:hypothetical protein [Streptomyces sp. ML-6]MDK0525057.1 hypothetical protein [Streptomyces sp. ML-6]
MTWPTAPELIALVLGAVAIAMICASQHGIGTTNPQDPLDGDTP